MARKVRRRLSHIHAPTMKRSKNTQSMSATERLKSRLARRSREASKSLADQRLDTQRRRIVVGRRSAAHKLATGKAMVPAVKKSTSLVAAKRKAMRVHNPWEHVKVLKNLAGHQKRWNLHKLAKIGKIGATVGVAGIAGHYVRKWLKGSKKSPATGNTK